MLFRSLRAIVGMLGLSSTVPADGGGLREIPFVVNLLESGVALETLVTGTRALLVVYLALFGLLGILVYRGHRWARTAGLMLSTAGVLVWASLWWFGVERGATVMSLLGTALEILVILALSSDTARIYVGSRPGEPERNTTGEVRG